MDEVSSDLARFVLELGFDDVGEQTRAETCKRLVDTVACAIGGSDSEPARIARRVAQPSSGAEAATVWVTGEKVDLQSATFANTVMTRYLDYNDTWLGVDPGHPSDAIAGLLAIAETTGASGRDLLVAIVAAYEVSCVFLDAMPLRDCGWDHGLYTGLSVAAAGGRLLGLEARQVAEAASLAVCPYVPTRQVRAGELSLWKGCASAAACRNGIFAAVLARAGMTGPSQPFLGEFGIGRMVTDRLRTPVYAAAGGPFALDRTHLKGTSVEYHLQAPAEGALALRERVAEDDLEAIEVSTYWLAYTETGREPEKWDPTRRETADHSMPYVMARAFRDGRMNPASFAPDKIADPSLRPLMQRISVREDEVLSAAYPGQVRSRFDVTTRAGERFSIDVGPPRGHVDNPLSREEVDAKFSDMVVPVLGEPRAEELRAALWGITEVDDCRRLTELLAAR